MAGLASAAGNWGVFYNADIRNNGTARRFSEAASRMGFRQRGMVRYTRPYPKHDKHDWYIFIDDGRDDILWMPPKPNACWLIDTHLGYEKRLEWAKQFDKVFLAQKADVARMQGDGVQDVSWLPLACSPYLDPCYEELVKDRGRKVDLTRQWDCCFVGFLNQGITGHLGSHNRIEFLDRMFREFPNSWLAFGRFFDEAAEIYVKSRVGLNVSIGQDLNMRFFEGLSYGVCQVCNRDMDGWKELGFEDEKHFLGWDTVEEAIEKVGWALKHPQERDRIGEEGMKFVRAGHTYEHRVGEMLKKL